MKELFTYDSRIYLSYISGLFDSFQILIYLASLLISLSRQFFKTPKRTANQIKLIPKVKQFFSPFLFLLICLPISGLFVTLNGCHICNFSVVPSNDPTNRACFVWLCCILVFLRVIGRNDETTEKSQMVQTLDFLACGLIENVCSMRLELKELLIKSS